jgi:CDP-glucose 4,6-dehydratase
MTDFQWQGRRTLITGAAGFIGRWLAEDLLRRGASVLCMVLPAEEDLPFVQVLSKSGARLLVGKVEDLPLLQHSIESEKVDSVFHLAAINVNFGSDVSPMSIFETNIRGTYNLLAGLEGRSGELSWHPAPKRKPWRKRHLPGPGAGRDIRIKSRKYQRS